MLPRVTALEVAAFLQATGPLLAPVREALTRTRERAAGNHTGGDGSHHVPSGPRQDFLAMETVLLRGGADPVAAGEAAALAVLDLYGPGVRHNALLSITNELARCGWSPEQAAALMGRAMARDPDKWADNDWPRKAAGMVEAAIPKHAEYRQRQGAGCFGR